MRDFSRDRPVAAGKGTTDFTPWQQGDIWMQLRILLYAAVVGIGLAPASSRAGIVFTLGNNPQPGEENVLLNKGTTGNTVFGETNQSNTTVEFTSTQLLTEPANGQARIEATNGTSQIGLTNVTISVPNGTLQDLIF